MERREKEGKGRVCERDVLALPVKTPYLLFEHYELPSKEGTLFTPSSMYAYMAGMTFR